MSYDFSGKVALVTGASRGIGREIIRQLDEAGAKVFALAKTQENLDNLKAEIPNVQTICVDVGDWNETRKLVNELEDIDLLVNNAAIVIQKSFEDVTEEQVDSIFSVNLKAALNVSQIVAEKLKKQGKPGSIVHVSSVASTKYFPNAFVYSISKAALDKLTKMMAVELAPFKIRVNSVNPTVVNTDMIKPLLENKEFVNLVMKDIPLNDFCSVGDIADSVLFLLSDKARMITGTNLAVDGGHCSK